MSTDLMEKVIQTSSIGDFQNGPGLLQPEQSDRFIDYMWDATVLGKLVRRVPMRANDIEIDRIGIGTRLLRLATEAVDDAVNVGVAFAKVSLTTRKLRLDWELSSEALEDNIEGADLEDHIARMMAQRVGEDLEFLFINGDVTETLNPLLKSFNGYGALGREHGIVKDAANQPLTNAVLATAVRAMPRQYMQDRQGLRLLSSSGAVQNLQVSREAAAFGAQGYVDPRWVQAVNNTDATGSAGWTVPGALGFNLTEVPLMREDLGTSNDNTELWFTNPKNLIWGVKREIKVLREYKNKKDTIEYTLYTRVGAAIENEDAFVVVKNVKVNV